MRRSVLVSIFAVGVVAALVGTAAKVAADANSQLTQEINSGTLTTSIRDAAGAVVAAPSFAMDTATASTSVQTVTGTFGSDSQRITVDNASGAGNWTLALNATTPGSELWTSGSDTYAYNGVAPADGQLTVNPAAGTITANGGGSTTGITLGTQATFSGSTAITLATASGSADPIWNGYITGVGLSQTIPASQALGSYTLDLTQTVSNV